MQSVNHGRRGGAGVSAFVSLSILASCSAATGDDGAPSADVSAQDLSAAQQLFDSALPGTNGRACAHCHVQADHHALSPDRVIALLATDPGNPLFDRLDADDPGAAIPRFEHLKKGLVRVTLPLPENMDVIDAKGNVVTPADRKVSVWRGVPTVENTAYGAPFQSDGRLQNLEDQAQAAITSHSAGVSPSRDTLAQIARFERSVFSSERARSVAQWAALGVPGGFIPVPEDTMALSAEATRGRQIYRGACQACHGGGTTTIIVNRPVHDILFNKLKPDGNVQWFPIAFPGSTPFSIPVQDPRPFDEFLNAGYAYMSYLGQIGRMPELYNASVDLPRYRFRFYTDRTRRVPLTDLPPIPVTASGDPLDPNAALDPFNALIAGPNFFAQAFTTDPGRALITGDPLDFEGFDIPQLRGAARTGPYFHDNSHATLRDVVDSYSRRLLPFLLPLNLPATFPAESPGGPKESLTPAQKQDLLAFLEVL